MIYCKDKNYAKVWKIVKKTDKYMDLQMTTSEKDRDGVYINSSWFPRVIGHAFQSLKDTLKEGDRIILNGCKFTNERYTAQDGTVKSAFRLLILDAALADDSTTKNNAEDKKESEPSPSQQMTAREAAKQPADCPW